jgi:hypothetical protein
VPARPWPEDTLPEGFLGTASPNDREAILTRERLQELLAEYDWQRTAESS